MFLRADNEDSDQTSHMRMLICVFVERTCQNVRFRPLRLIFHHKTYLYNFDLLKPHFYIAKLGLQGYTLFFLFLLKNIDCGYLLEPPRQGGSNEYPQSIF